MKVTVTNDLCRYCREVSDRDDWDICSDCACDLWESERPEREQRQRERLDAEGYYDNLR